MPAATMNRTASRSREARKRSVRKHLRLSRRFALAALLLAFVPASAAVHLYGCMRLDAASAKRAALKAQVQKLERGNIERSVRLDALTHPDRLSRIVEGEGMMQLKPSTLVSCPSPARMAKATDTLFQEGNDLR